MTLEEAITIIKNEFSEYADTLSVYAEKRKMAFDMAIKALEQTRWIPCSERLPKTRGAYLVTTKWESSFSSEVYTEIDIAVYRDKLKEWSNPDVIAWMPLPEPYKAESEVNADGERDSN